MTTLKCGEYFGDVGSTHISWFVSDMHILDFRADKVIQNREDMVSQVERFKADKTQFDYTDYNCGAKFHKAVREYDVPVQRLVDFYILVFEYQGKKYRLRTRKYVGVVTKVRQQAERILEDYTETVECLVSDATGDVLGEGTVIRTMDNNWLV